MIGETIQKIRKEKGITLSELAGRANMSKSYLSNIERNINQNPSILLLEKIAAVLDVSLPALVGTPSEPIKPHRDEWNDFIHELKKSGIEKEQLDQYKTVFEFIKWQNEKASEK